MRIINLFMKNLYNGLSYLMIFMLSLLFIIIITRYFFSYGNVALQELVMYCHAIIFMLGICYTLHDNSHVSIDIIVKRISKKKQDVVNSFFNIIFLLPISLFLIFVSKDMVIRSWSIMEGSSEAGGLNYVFVLKSIIPITGFLIFIISVLILVNDIKKFSK